MIRKDEGLIQLVCDECSAETATYEEDQFHTMIQDAKNDWWEIARPDGTWTHLCGTCTKPSGDALAAAKKKFGLA